ncbi:MAG: adenylate/guanylate cyclase domain-containing protein [Candidatus Taylorbacteria bacterium]|nr:adenylate/guanylate cyclase domain-containing protein [Candidatus Taylorbacteria bacterium]
MNLTKKILLGTAAFLLIAGLSKTNFFESAELKAGDVFKRARLPAPGIVILAIDNKSLSDIGRWPWPRETQARIISKIAISKPRALGLDISLFESQDQINDSALASSFTKVDFPVVFSSQAVFIKGSEEPKNILLPLNIFLSNPLAEVGHVNVDITPDGLARNLPRELKTEKDNLLPFSFKLAIAANAKLPENRRDYRINFAGPSGSFPTYSVSDLLSGQVSPAIIENKIVLLGATAGDLHDLVPAPVSRGFLPGVEWHANVLDNVLFERYVKPINRNAVILLFTILSLTLSIVFFKTNRNKFLIISTIYLSAPILVSSVLWNLKIDFPYLTGTVFAAVTVAYEGFFRWHTAEAEKRKLRQAVQNYFSPSVLEAILANPALLSLQGEKKEITILFSDIRSFTTITEQVEPDALTEMLHEYFSEMTEEILATDGVIDKFIGDAIMAFWGAPLKQPDHAMRAVKSAKGMMNRLIKIQERRKLKKLPAFDIGIGINTGTAIVGNMGSEKRFDYTAIGDSVNIASRIEGLNKDFGTHIIISESTKNSIGSEIKTRGLGQANLKGKSDIVNIFEVV